MDNQPNAEPQPVTAGAAPAPPVSPVAASEATPAAPAPVEAPVAVPQTQVAPAPQATPEQFPAKYGVLRAVRDTLGAMRVNLGTFVVSVLLSGAVTLVTGAIIIFGIAAGVTGTPTHSGGEISMSVGVVAATVSALIIWYTLAGAFLMSFTALAIYAGANGRRSGIGETMRTSLARMGRMVGALLLTGLVVAGPLLVTALVTLTTLNRPQAPYSVLLFLLPFLGLIWVYIALLRFALAPYVALFELDVPVMKVLSRSSALMRKGGQWFVVKGIGLLFLLAILVSVLDGKGGQGGPGGQVSLLANLFMSLVSLVASGALVLLYRNRKVVRG